MSKSAFNKYITEIVHRPKSFECILQQSKCYSIDHKYIFLFFKMQAVIFQDEFAAVRCTFGKQRWLESDSSNEQRSGAVLEEDRSGSRDRVSLLPAGRPASMEL